MVHLFRNLMKPPIKWYKAKSIRTKIFIYFLVLNIFSFVMLYIFVYRSYYDASLKQSEFLSGEILKNIEANMELTFKTLSDLSLRIYSDRQLNELILEDYTLSSLYQIDENAYEEKRVEINRLLRQYIDTYEFLRSIRLYVGDAAYYSTRNSEILAKKTDAFYNSNWPERAFMSDGKVVFVPTYTQQYSINGMSTDVVKVVSLARAIKNLKQIYKNEKIGILTVDLEESYLKSLYSHINLSKNNFTIICTSDGEIVSATYDHLVGKNVYNEGYLSEIPESDNGNIISQIRNKKYLISYKSFNKADWKILTFVLMSDLNLAQTTFNQTVLGLTAICVVANLILSFIITRILSNPINKLIKVIKFIRNGNLSQRVKVINYDEIGEIGLEFNKMLDYIENLLNENYLARIKEKEAQIKSLQAQINPHFLYNTLDTIGWKVLLMGGDDISKIVNALGEILRYSISTSNSLVTLEQDLQQVKNYLYIQSVRYEDRFKVYYHIQPETLQLKVNKLLIQPIVENSILHGLENKESGGVLCLTSKIKDQNLIIEITDNGCGISEERIHEIFSENTEQNDEHSHSHIGLINIRERIRLYYGNSYGMEIKSRIGKFTKVILFLPVIREVLPDDKNCDCR